MKIGLALALTSTLSRSGLLAPVVELLKGKFGVNAVIVTEDLTLTPVAFVSGNRIVITGEV